MIHNYPWIVNVLQFQSSCDMSKKNKQAPLPKCQPDKIFPACCDIKSPTSKEGF